MSDIPIPVPTKTAKWIDYLPIIARFGLPVAEAIWRKVSSGQDPTDADWLELKAMDQQTPEDMVLKAAQLVGIPPNDPRVAQLLALVAPPSP